jgi:hypothetical protein
MLRVQADDFIEARTNATCPWTGRLLLVVYADFTMKPLESILKNNALWSDGGGL